jgi:hypothetical protein
MSYIGYRERLFLRVPAFFDASYYFKVVGTSRSLKGGWMNKRLGQSRLLNGDQGHTTNKQF